LIKGGKGEEGRKANLKKIIKSVGLKKLLD